MSTASLSGMQLGADVEKGFDADPMLHLVISKTLL